MECLGLHCQLQCYLPLDVPMSVGRSIPTRAQERPTASPSNRTRAGSRTMSCPARRGPPAWRAKAMHTSSLEGRRWWPWKDGHAAPAATSGTSAGGKNAGPTVTTQAGAIRACPQDVAKAAAPIPGDSATGAYAFSVIWTPSRALLGVKDLHSAPPRKLEPNTLHKATKAQNAIFSAGAARPERSQTSLWHEDAGDKMLFAKGIMQVPASGRHEDLCFLCPVQWKRVASLDRFC